MYPWMFQVQQQVFSHQNVHTARVSSTGRHVHVTFKKQMHYNRAHPKATSAEEPRRSAALSLSSHEWQKIFLPRQASGEGWRSPSPAPGSAPLYSKKKNPPQTMKIWITVEYNVKGECGRAGGGGGFKDKVASLLIIHLPPLSDLRPSFGRTHPQLVLQQVDLVGKDLVPVQKQRHPGCGSVDGERESRMEILVPDTRPVHWGHVMRLRAALPTPLTCPLSRRRRRSQAAAWVVLFLRHRVKRVVKVKLFFLNCDYWGLCLKMT